MMIRTALAAGFLLLLTACKGGNTAPQAAQTTTTDTKPGLTLINGRLVLPTVKGNPGAAYFNLANGSDAAATIAAISIAGSSRTELHDSSSGQMAALKTLPLAANGGVAFEPGGKHVMVFDLDPKLVAGGTAELTVTFADGDKLSAPLKVEAPGGMDHGAEH